MINNKRNYCFNKQDIDDYKNVDWLFLDLLKLDGLLFGNDKYWQGIDNVLVVGVCLIRVFILVLVCGKNWFFQIWLVFLFCFL